MQSTAATCPPCATRSATWSSRPYSLAQLCAEDGHFSLADALAAAAAKLIRRHPHVFGEAAGTGALTSDDVKRSWEQIKADERREAGETPSLLGTIPPALPALLRAYRIGRRAATVGFDWQQPGDVLDKVREELAEVETAAERGEADEVVQRKSAICCWPPPASRATWVWSRKPPCAPPTASSRGVSRPSSSTFAAPDARCRTYPPARWTPPGNRSSSANGTEARYGSTRRPSAVRTRSRRPSEQTSTAPTAPVASTVAPAAA